jgi:hypothetical protein
MDNGMTDTTPRHVDSLTPQAGAAPAGTPASGANLNVIHQAAHGEMEVPTMGRVAVTARTRDGVVDVTVTAAKSSLTEYLAPHAAAIAADVRAAHVPLRRLDLVRIVL